MTASKYEKWYCTIIQKARRRSPISMGERHHILPKSMGGTNDQSNLVLLTPREHFICHLLLSKFTTGSNKYKMTAALCLMVKNTARTLNRSDITSRHYDMGVLFSRVEFSAEHRAKISKAMKGVKRGPQSPELIEKRRLALIGKNVGKSHVTSDETKEKIRKANTGSKRTSAQKHRISAAMVGKPKSDEAKMNMAAASKKKWEQTKFIWLHNSEGSIRIDEKIVTAYINDGWKRGRGKLPRKINSY